MAPKPIPDGFHTVTPFLLVSGAAGLLAFLKKAFDAQQIEHVELPDGTVAHAEVRIGDSIVMIGEARGGCPPMPGGLYLYVPNVDAVYQRAMEAGGISVMAPADQFYGDRCGGVKDPSGNIWWVATHVEDVSPDELKKCMAERARREP